MLFRDLVVSDYVVSDYAQSCRVIYREMFGGVPQDPELLESILTLVVEEYVDPNNLVLHAMLRGCNPEYSDDELRLNTHSVLGHRI